MDKYAALAKLNEQCLTKRNVFRVKNTKPEHDDAYLSGCMLYSSVLRFLAHEQFFAEFEQHMSKRPKDKVFLSQAKNKLKKSGLLADRKLLKSRTRWTNFDKQLMEVYIKLLDQYLSLF